LEEMMTPDELTAIATRATAAARHFGRASADRDLWCHPAHAGAIAASAEDVPRLLAELTALRALLAEAREALEPCTNIHRREWEPDAVMVDTSTWMPDGNGDTTYVERAIRSRDVVRVRDVFTRITAALAGGSEGR
jgi:hypothetical protein